jgi:glyoxylase-like metal-dependent hydrolase (beta-lactamase superfamily II)
VSVHAIDLRHHGLDGTIASYLLLDDEAILVDPGPASTLPELRTALRGFGLEVADLRHVLLTHVHLDHAGASGDLVAENPRIRLHVHLEGAPHMANPERLVASTRRTFGEAHDELWGTTRPVPADAIVPWEPGTKPPRRRLRAVPTPGHIGHHLAYLDEGDGTVFTGDALGVVLSASAPTHPPTPPPAVDLTAWRRSLLELRALRAERAAVAHFGIHGDVEARAIELQECLDGLESRVRKALALGRADQDVVDYDLEARATLEGIRPAGWVERYFEVFKASTDWEGVRRWIETSERSDAGRS